MFVSGLMQTHKPIIKVSEYTKGSFPDLTQPLRGHIFPENKSLELHQRVFGCHVLKHFNLSLLTQRKKGMRLHTSSLLHPQDRGIGRGWI